MKHNAHIYSTNKSQALSILLNFFIAGLLYLALATGTIFPVDRDDGKIYIHTIFISIFALFLISNKEISFILLKSLFVLSPIYIVLFTSLLSTNIDELAYGKIEGAAFATLLSICIASYLLNIVSIDDFLKYFISFSFFVLIITLVYRNVLGLESRDDRFFINGPIVFGWIMGLNALISFFLYQKEKSRLYLLPAAIFIAATLLTGSKGPTVAVALAVIMLSLRWVNRASTWVFIVFGAVSLFASANFISQDNLERFMALERLISGESSELDYGSVGTRYDAWTDSIEMFLSHPVFGVGLGNWNLYAINKIDYPHNFIMEIISETGVIGLAAFSISIAYIIIRADLLGRIIVLYFMVCMSFSGDMSYYRFMIAVPLAMILVTDSTTRTRQRAQ